MNSDRTLCVRELLIAVDSFSRRRGGDQSETFENILTLCITSQAFQRTCICSLLLTIALAMVMLARC